jgi:hypothetical protein
MKTFYMTGITTDVSYTHAVKWAKQYAPAYVYHTGQGNFSVVTLSETPVQPNQHPFIIREDGGGELFELEQDRPDDGSRDGGDWMEGDF